jgi:hypothetical protein
MAVMLWLTNRTVRPLLATLSEGLLLELGVTDGQDLVDQQDLRLEVRRHREAQPHPHAAGVALDLRVDELAHAGEIDDLVELRVGFLLAHAEDRAAQVDVLAAGQLLVESRPHLQEAGHPSVQHGPPPGGLGYPGQDLQQRALAGAVAPDYPQHLAVLHLKRDVPQSPDRVFLAVGGTPEALQAAHRSRGRIHDGLAEGAPLHAAGDAVLLRNALNDYGGLAHLRPHPPRSRGYLR